LKTTYSLHKIVEENNYPFDPYNYSWFKFGDKHHAEIFATNLYEGFIKEFGDIIVKQDEIIILPSPYLAIPTASNFLCEFFTKKLNVFLFKNGKKACLESKIYRNQTYVTDYGNLDFEERIKLISNDTYYIDRNFIAGKFCVFVDDIKITGSHEYTVNKILNYYNIQGDFVFVYFAELLNENIHPNIENHFNYYAVKGITQIVELVNRYRFQFNTRIIKYILNLDKKDLKFLLENMDSSRSKQLFDLAVSNNYHQITEYKTNINLISLEHYGN
jgi:hypothetical protein